MSYLEKVTLKAALPILEKTYKSFGLKSIVLLKDQEWVNVTAIIDCTHRTAEDLNKEYRLVEERLGTLDFENFKVILESKPINDIHNIIDEIEKGYLTIGRIKTKLLCDNPKEELENRQFRRSYFLMRYGEYAEYESHYVGLGMPESIETILSTSGISASMLGTSLIDLGRSWLGLESLVMQVNVFFNFPMYAKMIRTNYEGGNEIIATFKVPEKMIDGCKAWIIRKASGDIAPILERKDYGLTSCDKTIQDDFAYITLKHDFNAINLNDEIQINLFHKDLGFLFTEKTRLGELVKPSEDSLIQSFNLFDAGQKLEENLLNPQNDKIFVTALSWLLEMIKMRCLKLEKFETIRENKTERGSADILAYDLISKKLFVIDCTLTPPPANKIDKIKNTASYISNKIDNVAKPLIITASHAPAVKDEAEKHGVIILDKTNLEELLDLFKKGKIEYPSFRNLIFKE